MSFDDRVGEVLGGQRGGRPHREPPTIVEAEAISTTEQGVTFTISSWDGGVHRYGPAPWTMSRIEPVEGHQHSDPDAPTGVEGGHDHVETTPQAGDRLLVVFVWSGVEQRRVPWVIGWWP